MVRHAASLVALSLFRLSVLVSRDGPGVTVRLVYLRGQCRCMLAHDVACCTVTLSGHMTHVIAHRILAVQQVSADL